MLERDKAIVIRHLDFSETSQVLCLFTQNHGKLRVLAKGVCRPKNAFGGPIDLLVGGEAVVSLRPKEGLLALTQWRLKQPFTGLRGDLERLHAGLYAAELTDLLSKEEDPAPQVFRALALGLMDLSQGRGVIPTLLLFQSALLQETGFWPHWQACAVCRGAGLGAPFFSSSLGGPLCLSCAPARREKTQMSEKVRRLLGGLSSAGRLLGRPHASVAPETALAAVRLLGYHLACTIGRRPRLARHF